MFSSSNTSRTVERTWSGPRCARVPKSGLASTAMTRSPRTAARVAPSPTVMVVLPTPPFCDSTAMLNAAADRLVDPIDQCPAAGLPRRFARVVTGGAMHRLAPTLMRQRPACAPDPALRLVGNCVRGRGVGRCAGERCRTRRPQRAGVLAGRLALTVLRRVIHSSHVRSCVRSG